MGCLGGGVQLLLDLGANCAAPARGEASGSSRHFSVRHITRSHSPSEETRTSLGQRCWRLKGGPLLEKTKIAEADRNVGMKCVSVFGLSLHPARTLFPTRTLQVAFQGRFLQLQRCAARDRSWWTPCDGWREEAKALFVSVPSADPAEFPSSRDQ